MSGDAAPHKLPYRYPCDKTMRALLTLLTALLLTGCATAEDFWNNELLGVYAPETLRRKQAEQAKGFLIDALNYWLGRPKSDYIRVIGAPDRCTALNTGGEVCEWSQRAPRPEQRVSFTYSREGIARAWSYRGDYGQLTNADAQARGGQAAPASAVSPSR